MHRYLGRMNLMGELQGIRDGEGARHQSALVSVEPPEPGHRNPYGAATQSTHRRAARSRASSVASMSRATTGKSAPSEEQQIRRPGLLEFKMPQDPTEMPNPHVPRREAIDGLIFEQEQKLAESRSESALRLMQGGVEVKPTVFHWDRQHPGTELSDYQSEFFPRSIKVVRELGGGKNSDFCRPFDVTYLHREAMCRQKHVQRV